MTLGHPGQAPLEPAQVHAHAGGRGEEEPRSFEWAGARLEVREILVRWREPGGRYFRVVAEDGTRYLLVCREPDLNWWLCPGG